jgi:hypothetical protein
VTVPPRAEGPSPSDAQFQQGQRPGQSSYGQQQSAAKPPSSWPIYPPTRDAQPGRVPVKFGVVAIIAMVVAAIGAGLAIWSIASPPEAQPVTDWASDDPVASTTVATPSPARSASASASPTPSTVGNCVGTDARALGWSATVPTGWSCQWVNGREIYIQGPQGDTIEVSASKVSPGAACGTNLLQGTVSVMALPDSTWGQKTASTANFKDQVWNGQARCTSSNTITYVMLGVAYSGRLDNVITAENLLAHSWVWK